MRFLVSSPPEGVPGKHVVTCTAAPAPSIERCETREAAQSLADDLTLAYERWQRSQARLQEKGKPA